MEPTTIITTARQFITFCFLFATVTLRGRLSVAGKKRYLGSCERLTAPCNILNKRTGVVIVITRRSLAML